MISERYIIDTLSQIEKKGLKARCVRRKKNSTINLVEIIVEHLEKEEHYVIYSTPYFKQKVFIETKNQNSLFTRDELYEIERAIVDGVLKTPKNIFPNLMNPIYFTSSQFLNLHHPEENTNEITQKIEKEIVPILENKVTKEFSQALFGLAYPRCHFEDSINSILSEIPLVREIRKEDNKNVICFYSFEEHWAKEKEFLKKIEQKMSGFGLVSEIHLSLCMHENTL